jgi:hypothetical protein
LYHYIKKPQKSHDATQLELAHLSKPLGKVSFPRPPLDLDCFGMPSINATSVKATVIIF